MPSPEMLLTERLAGNQEKVNRSGDDGDGSGEDEGLYRQLLERAAAFWS